MPLTLSVLRNCLNLTFYQVALQRGIGPRGFVTGLTFKGVGAKRIHLFLYGSSKKPHQERLFALAIKIYLQVAGKYLAGTVLFSLQEYTKL